MCSRSVTKSTKWSNCDKHISIKFHGYGRGKGMQQAIIFTIIHFWKGMLAYSICVFLIWWIRSDICFWTYSIRSDLAYELNGLSHYQSNTLKQAIDISTLSTCELEGNVFELISLDVDIITRYVRFSYENQIFELCP